MEKEWYNKPWSEMSKDEQDAFCAMHQCDGFGYWPPGHTPTQVEWAIIAVCLILILIAVLFAPYLDVVK